MMDEYDLGVVIPARLDSSRVRHKVLQSIDGRYSLIERKVLQLRALLPSDRVVVNTESELIAERARRCGATVQFRDDYYARGHVATFSEVIVHVVQRLDFEHVAWAPCVVPFYDSMHFAESFKSYRNQVVRGKYDSLVSVIPAKSYFWSFKGPLNYQANKNHPISQDLPDWFMVTNGNYMAPKKEMLENKYLLGKKVFLDIKPELCGVDIDTVADLEVARALNIQQSAFDEVDDNKTI